MPHIDRGRLDRVKHAGTVVLAAALFVGAVALSVLDLAMIARAQVQHHEQG